MWGNKKDAAAGEETLEATVPAIVRPDPPAAAPATARAAASVISLGTSVSGSVTASGDVQIDGVVQGDVRCGRLTVGSGGEIKGNVIAETALVRGTVHGDVRARTIQLAGTGVINGDLTHAVLIIEEGGSFEGRSKRLADPLADTPQIEGPAAQSATAPAAETGSGSALADALGDDFTNKAD
jgi:cytoskeletal protein CcmA (bactofilin family)